MEELQRDVTEVKQMVTALTVALTGDIMNKGALADIREDIESHDKEIHELNATVHAIQSKMFTTQERADIIKFVDYFKGYKLVIGGLLYLIALATPFLIQLLP
jgi:hypothetical protein